MAIFISSDSDPSMTPLIMKVWWVPPRQWPLLHRHPHQWWYPLGQQWFQVFYWSLNEIQSKNNRLHREAVISMEGGIPTARYWFRATFFFKNWTSNSFCDLTFHWLILEKIIKRILTHLGEIAVKILISSYHVKQKKMKSHCPSVNLFIICTIILLRLKSLDVSWWGNGGYSS